MARYGEAMSSSPKVIAFDHTGLGDRSYLLLDEPAGLGAVIDPQRDIEPYQRTAAAHGCRIVLALETHLHNDFVSGARRLAAAGATVVAGREGDLAYPHRAVHDGDVVELGAIRIDVRATPGHTPEHVSFLVRGEPPLLFSGGALSPGGAARIDLFGPDEARRLAALAHATVRGLLGLEGRTEVLATHVGGSFCSSGAHGPADTTIAAEREQNRFAAVSDAAAFLIVATTDIPPAPTYYPAVRARNRSGDLSDPPRPLAITHERLAALARDGVTIVDTRPSLDYDTRHLRGSLAIGLDGPFGPWTAWISPPDRPIALVVADPAGGADATTALAAVGRDDLKGFAVGIDGAVLETAAIARVPARSLLAAGRPPVLDVRWAHEWRDGHIPGATHQPLDRLAQGGGGPPVPSPRVAIHCAEDYRSTIGASLLERAGTTEIVHIADGFSGWVAAGGPIATER
jgi:hydroxyacylglutathione hydrolase